MMFRCCSNISFSLILVFTQYKTTWLTAISSHCLVALPAKDVYVQQSQAAKPVMPDGCHVKLLKNVKKNC